MSLILVGGGFETDGSIAAIYILSELVTAIACFTTALGIAWYARHRRGMADEYRRAAVLLYTFALTCGLTRIVDISPMWFPHFWVVGWLKAFTAATSLAAAAALLPKLPGLVALPLSRDLMDANRRLAAQEEARIELVDRLRKLNDELARSNERAFGYA